jgi:hypothetical protein
MQSWPGLLPAVIQLDAGPAELRRTGRHAKATIRTHVTSRMCASSSDHHGTTYDDFERLDRSRYRLRPHLAATGPDYQGERLDHGA